MIECLELEMRGHSKMEVNRMIAEMITTEGMTTARVMVVVEVVE